MNNRISIPKGALWLGIALVVVGAGISLKERIHAEGRNKATTLAVELPLIQSAAVGSGRTIEQELQFLREHGLGAVVLSEETAGDALSNGLIDASEHNGRTAFRGDQATIDRLRHALVVRAPKAYHEMEDGALQTDVPMDSVRTFSLGLSPQEALAVRSAGLAIIARHNNGPGLTTATIRDLLQSSHNLGASAYLPMGEQVLGQRDLVPDTAQALNDFGMNYLAAEFTKISGDAKLSELSKENLIRLHSIQSAEADKATPGEYVERFSKAARERNIRILLLRPLTSTISADGDGVSDTLDLVRIGLAKEGVPLGAARPFEGAKVPKFAFVAVGLGIVLAGLWTAMNLFAHRGWQMASAAILLLGAALTITEHQRWVPALLGACVFPVAAYLLLMQQTKVSAWLSYVVTSAVSLVGGLCVAGLLNGLEYMIRVDQFTGVKAAHFIPIVVVLFIVVGRDFNWREALSKPANWAGIFAALLGLIVLGLMLARTGNDNPGAVSSVELKLRSLLDWVFYTRPRTKEFMLGHPAMLLGLLSLAQAQAGNAAAKTWRSLAVVLLIVGAIGQTSIVNTCCHLHTPFLLSIARIGIGLLLGALVGIAAWWPLKWMVQRTAVAEGV